METISRLVLGFLLNASWQVALTAGVAALGARMLRNGPARYRHALWVMALGMSVLLPLSSLPGSVPRNRQRWAGLAIDEAHSAVTMLPPAPPAASVLRRPGVAPRFKDRFSHRDWPVEFSPWLAYSVLGCYSLLLLFRIGRLCRAWHRTNEVRRSAQLRPLPAWMASSVWRCQVALGLGHVPILYSLRLPGPVALGVHEPLIILPASMFEGSSAEDLTSTLCHEMAHIRRHDFLMNLVYEFLYLLISFHPAGVLIKRRIDQTRELACDEMAAGRLLSTSAYARSLVDLSRRAAGLPRASGYTLGVFDANTLEERVMRLLDKRPRASARLAKLILVAALSTLALLGMGATMFSVSVRQNSQTGTAGRSHPDFSGRWELDKAKSNLPPVSPDDLVQVIDHRDPQLRIITTSKDWTGDFWQNTKRPIALTLFALTIAEWVATTDGVERSEKYAPAELKSKTHWDGDRLLTSWSLERDGKVEIAGEWERSLSADGRTQTLKITAHDPQRGGHGEAKLLFVKASGNSAESFVGISADDAAGIGGGVSGGVGDGIPGGVVKTVSQNVKSDPPEGAPGLSGIVFDPSGARVPNAVVNIMNDYGVVRRVTATNDVGEFAFFVLPPGQYQLEVIGPGFAAYHQRIRLPGEASPPLDVVLKPGSMTESVEVTAKAEPGTRTAPPNAPPHRIRVGGMVQAGKLIEQKKPDYPESARVRGIEGAVLLEAVISLEGIPLNWKVLSSPDPDLSQAAIDAVRQWRYEPTLLNGEPIEVVTTISVRFRLRNVPDGSGTDEP